MLYNCMLLYTYTILTSNRKYILSLRLTVQLESFHNFLYDQLLILFCRENSNILGVSLCKLWKLCTPYITSNAKIPPKIQSFNKNTSHSSSKCKVTLTNDAPLMEIRVNEDSFDKHIYSQTWFNRSIWTTSTENTNLLLKAQFYSWKWKPLLITYDPFPLQILSFLKTWGQ